MMPLVYSKNCCRSTSREVFDKGEPISTEEIQALLQSSAKCKVKVVFSKNCCRSTSREVFDKGGLISKEEIQALLNLLQNAFRPPYGSESGTGDDPLSHWSTMMCACVGCIHVSKEFLVALWLPIL
jgi:hypothetical protein